MNLPVDSSVLARIAAANTRQVFRITDEQVRSEARALVDAAKASKRQALESVTRAAEDAFADYGYTFSAYISARRIVAYAARCILSENGNVARAPFNWRAMVRLLKSLENTPIHDNDVRLSDNSSRAMVYARAHFHKYAGGRHNISTADVQDGVQDGFTRLLSEDASFTIGNFYRYVRVGVEGLIYSLRRVGNHSSDNISAIDWNEWSLESGQLGTPAAHEFDAWREHLRYLESVDAWRASIDTYRDAMAALIHDGDRAWLEALRAGATVADIAAVIGRDPEALIREASARTKLAPRFVPAMPVDSDRLEGHASVTPEGMTCACDDCLSEIVVRRAHQGA